MTSFWDMELQWKRISLWNSETSFCTVVFSIRLGLKTYFCGCRMKSHHEIDC
jgi:hypothetical protein